MVYRAGHAGPPSDTFPGFRAKSPERAPGCRNAARPGAFLCLLAALVAAPQVYAATVFLDGTIGVIGEDGLPSGIGGGNEEINHTPLEGGANGSSEALVIDFGEAVSLVSASLAAFSDNEGGCKEVGRYTTFDASGLLIGSGTFVAPGPAVVEDVEGRPLRFIAFSAEPYVLQSNPALGCTVNGDSSDYSISSITYTDESDTERRIRYELPDPTTESPSPPPILILDGLITVASFYAYEIYQPFVDNGYLVKPDSELIVNPVIDVETCEGGTVTDGECVVTLGNQLTTTFANAGDISGTLQLASIRTISDPRAACAALEPSESAEPEPLTLDGTAGKPAYPAADGGFLTIPAHLCGIPNADTGNREFVVVDLISDLIVESSVILHDVEDPENTDFACKSPASIVASDSPAQARSSQPVLGWLPKDGEIPVLNPGGVAVNVVEDLTSGCGSYRGSTGRMSYILYNLRHRVGTDYVPIIQADITQLATTLQQSDPCVSQGALTSVENSHMNKVIRYFGRGEYPRAKQELIIFRQILLDRRELAEEFPSCFYDANQTPPIVFVREGQEPGDGVKPRNFRGDLISQADHILYMLETMLGVLNPAIP